MSTTYLVLSNRVLRELNEVEMTSANFSSSRGIQTAIKNFVNRSLHDVYNELEELPSLHKETYHVTNAGQREYALPTADSPVSGDLQWRKIDWDTFYLKPNELVTNGEFTSNINNWTTIAGAGSASYNSSGNGRDDAIDVGASSERFDDIYATNGTIQTSDINEKQDIEDLSEAETRVAVAAKGLLKKYRWKSAVADKGDDARIHFGIMAQDLQQAFSAEGLDAGDYGMFISSTWTDETTGEEKTRLGVRYNELLAFIIAAI